MARRTNERTIGFFLKGAALLSIITLLSITGFVLWQGMPLIKDTGLIPFISGKEWAPTDGIFGIYPMIVGSAVVTLGALILGVPLGIACAIFLTELAPKTMARLLRPAIELMAAIPSVIYGFFGLVTIVPLIRGNLGGSGFSGLAGSLILALMILPTIINISEDAIRAVPVEYREGALALGSSQWQTIWKVVLPAAKSGIGASIILGMGRALGETMAVIMVTGNAPVLPWEGMEEPSILRLFLEPVRTLTGNVILEMGYASGEHQRALFATGIILFAMIMALNALANLVLRERS
jgi:phosphate transport system permease protein